MKIHHFWKHGSLWYNVLFPGFTNTPRIHTSVHPIVRNILDSNRCTLANHKCSCRICKSFYDGSSIDASRNDGSIITPPEGSRFPEGLV